MTLQEVLNDDKFPLAVDPMFITDKTSESDKKTRAQAILDLWLRESVKDRKILDFGCGEGHLVEEMTKRGAKAFGYDFVPIPTREAGIFTNDWQQIIANGPYDMVILYDVLDHSEGKNPVEILTMIKEVLLEKSSVRVRCHPWSSRHGTHLFHQANKAYLHLLFSAQELRDAGFVTPRTVCVLHPLATYQTWFGKSSYGVMERKVYNRTFENIFPLPPYRSMIVEKWRYSHLDESLRNGTGFPGYVIEQEFIDYTLKVFK
jgi:SAM-dependent methyltransferase